MRKMKMWLCMLLAIAMLAAVPAAMAEGSAEKTVPVYTVYEKANNAGMYLSIALKEDTESRMRVRLGQIAAANQDRFDDEQTAAKVVNGWFTSTRNNIDSLFDITEGSMGAVQIPGDALAMYDLIAVSDAEGRAMMVPFQNYERDLYGDLCEEALPVMQALLDSLLDPCFEAIVTDDTIVKTEEVKAQLEVAYDELRPTFALTIEDAQKALTPETPVREGLTVGEAIDLTNNLTMGNLGNLAPVKVAAENFTEAWYKLSLSDGSLSGTKLSAPVSLNEIRNTTTAGATAWLNEAGELIYLTASESALSADAATLTRLLAQQGGEGTGQVSADTGDNTESGEAKSSNVIWYVVAVLAVLAVAALLWYLLAGRNKGARVRSASGGGSVPVQNDGEDEPEEEKEQ